MRMSIELDYEETRKLVAHLNNIKLENGSTLTLTFQITELSTVKFKEAEVGLTINVTDELKAGEKVG